MKTIKKRDELQRKAERGEISPQDYLCALQKTWDQMSAKEHKAEAVKLRCS